MKYRNANRILESLKNGEDISEKEDPENILFLKELGLIEVRNKTVILNAEGKVAAEMGIQDYLIYHKTEKEILNFSPEKCRKNRKILLMIFFLLFTLLLATIFTDLPLPAVW